MYASKLEGTECDGSTLKYYGDIYITVGQVAMCLDPNETIYDIQVREAAEDEETIYWGWEDNEDGLITLIYPKEFLFNMCFPYGYENEEKKGDGRRIRVIVEEKVIFSKPIKCDTS